MYLLGTTYVALLLLIDVAFDRSPEAALIGVVIDLGGVTDRGTLRERLARVIGDPDLWLAYRLADGRYVDDAGCRSPTVQPSADRVVTPIEHDGRRLAVLVHDTAIDVDPALLPQIAAAASVALRNVELHADVRAQVVRIEDSRDRLLVAENAARRGFEADLEDGPQRRLRRVAALLAGIDGGDAEGRLGQAAARAETEDSADSAGAFFPRHWMRATSARRWRAWRKGCRSRSRSTLTSPRCRPNFGRRCGSSARRRSRMPPSTPPPRGWACRSSSVSGEAIVVTVRDDGRGGASMDEGSGLVGLRARVEALRGRLERAQPARAAGPWCARGCPS